MPASGIAPADDAGILAGLIRPSRRRIICLIREHLLFRRVRLMDRPVAYRGGIQTVFRRAGPRPSDANRVDVCARPASLLQALAVLGGPMPSSRSCNWSILSVAIVAGASPRQRGAISAATMRRFATATGAARWGDEAGAVPFEGGWRVCPSGPGMRQPGDATSSGIVPFRRGERTTPRSHDGLPWSGNFRPDETSAVH